LRKSSKLGLKKLKTALRKRLKEPRILKKMLVLDRSLITGETE
jgi:hypothetical protein